MMTLQRSRNTTADAPRMGANVFSAGNAAVLLKDEQQKCARQP